MARSLKIKIVRYVPAQTHQYSIKRRIPLLSHHYYLCLWHGDTRKRGIMNDNDGLLWGPTIKIYIKPYSNNYTRNTPLTLFYNTTHTHIHTHTLTPFTTFVHSMRSSHVIVIIIIVMSNSFFFALCLCDNTMISITIVELVNSS